MMSVMDVELLVVPDCPNESVALSVLRSAFDRRCAGSGRAARTGSWPYAGLLVSGPNPALVWPRCTRRTMTQYKIKAEISPAVRPRRGRRFGWKSEH